MAPNAGGIKGGESCAWGVLRGWAGDLGAVQGIQEAWEAGGGREMSGKAGKYWD